MTCRTGIHIAKVQQEGDIADSWCYECTAMLGLLHPVAMISATVVTHANLLHRLGPLPAYEREAGTMVAG